MPEEWESVVPAHSPPTGTCVMVCLFLLHYEIKRAVNQAVKMMAAGAPMLMGHLGRRLDIPQSHAARAAGVNPHQSPPDGGHPRDPWPGSNGI